MCDNSIALSTLDFLLKCFKRVAENLQYEFEESFEFHIANNYECVRDRHYTDVAVKLFVESNGNSGTFNLIMFSPLRPFFTTPARKLYNRKLFDYVIENNGIKVFYPFENTKKDFFWTKRCLFFFYRIVFER